MLNLRSYALFGLVALVVLAIAGALIERAQKFKAISEAETVRKEFAEYRSAQQESARLAERAQRAIEAQRVKNVQEIATNAQTEVEALSPVMAAARGAPDRLHIAATSAAQRGACANAAATAAGTREQGTDPLDLLTGVLDRHSRELVAVGEYADRLRIAGASCEASYDALTSPH